VIYFDHNATSPISTVALQSWIAANEKYAANPSSPHRLGSRAEVALSRARQEAASHLGCAEIDLVWTSGATEANNAIFFHASRNAEGEAWISGIEHPSVIAAACRWFPNKVRTLKVTSDGTADLNFLAEQLKRARPSLVAIMAANNEIGAIQPWQDALRLCRNQSVSFACDAAQWIGKEPAIGLGECDFVTGCAHKFGGPLGIGILKVPAGFQSFIVGGPQEEGRRAGTENLPAALAMSAAWTEREARMSSGQIDERIRWRDQFIAQLQNEMPEVEILGLPSSRLWNTVAALMPATFDCRRRWVVQLDKLGFAVSTGSACASGKEKPSHVLMAMGCDPSKSDRMLRFSSGWETTEDDWHRLLGGIKDAFAELSQSR
jgi:cysteine desulfurase